MSKRMKIEIIIRDDKLIELESKHKRVFRSYAAVMRALSVGDIATVRVESKYGGFGWVCEGFGNVTRTGLQSYTCPKRLMPEY